VTAEFCKRLAKNRYYLALYNHRETGRYNYVDYEKNLYALKYLMVHAKGVFDALDLIKVHALGFL
jgi:hypothetical protein